MSYKKQGFYAGQPLKASQLEAIEDGIIEAQNLASGNSGTSGSGAPVRLVQVCIANGGDCMFLDRESKYLGGEMLFYSSETFNSIRDVYNFFERFNNGSYMAYHPFPVWYRFEVANEDWSDMDDVYGSYIMTYNEMFALDFIDVSLVDLEAHSDEIQIIYYDI